jgi:hypothetical protein
MTETRVLRRIFGHKRDELRGWGGGLRSALGRASQFVLPKEYLYNDEIKKMEWVEHVHWEMRNMYKILVRKSKRNRPLGIYRGVYGRILLNWKLRK